jgi:hypothetical protein
MWLRAAPYGAALCFVLLQCCQVLQSLTGFSNLTFLTLAGRFWNQKLSFSDM